MVEHQLPKLAFAGSIPVSRSIRHSFMSAFYFYKGNRIGSREVRALHTVK